MQRHWTRRLGALLFGLWFVLAGFDSGAADGCSMESMPGSSASSMPMGSTGATASQAPNSMPMGSESHHQSDSGHQHSHCPCCCSCCATLVLDVPARPDYIGRVSVPALAPVASVIATRETRGAFVLPFATAPPRGLPA